MLRESYILFICKNDPFKDKNDVHYGLPCYTFSTVCTENTAVNLNDKTTKLVYNASAYEKEEDEWIRRFLSYVYTGKTGEDDFANYLSAMVEKIKQDDKFRSLYLSMNLHDFDIREEAKEEGAQQKAIEAAINLLKMKLGTPEQIAQAQGLPIEKVLELQQQLMKNE
jgi:predicted transposase YdaD